jgi:hypothetical protein
MTNKRAREIYVMFHGSSFHMDRDGLYDEYKSFEISRDVEEKWAEEEFLAHMTAFTKDPVATSDFYALINWLRILHSERLLVRFLDSIGSHIPRTDSFSLLRFAEELFELTCGWLGNSGKSATSAVGHLTNPVIEALLKTLEDKEKYWVAEVFLLDPTLQGVLEPKAIYARRQSLIQKMVSQ